MPFSQLPSELRLKIWRNTFPPPRVVDIDYDVEEQRCLTKTLPPIALYINHESRTEALRFYQLAFGAKSTSSTNLDRPRIYFDFDRDIFLVNCLTSAKWHTASERFFNRRHCRLLPGGLQEFFPIFAVLIDDTEDIDKLQNIALGVRILIAAANFTAATNLRLAKGLFPRIGHIPNLFLAFLLSRDKTIEGINTLGFVEVVTPELDPDDVLRSVTAAIGRLQEQTELKWKVGRILGWSLLES